MDVFRNLGKIVFQMYLDGKKEVDVVNIEACTSTSCADGDLGTVRKYREKQAEIDDSKRIETSYPMNV